MSISYKRLITRLVKLRMQFDRARIKVLSAKPSIDTKRDIRITSFSKCNVVIDSSVLILMFCDKYIQ
jgi:hypothetical protein